jgi:hypothetical protein
MEEAHHWKPTDRKKLRIKAHEKLMKIAQMAD